MKTYTEQRKAELKKIIVDYIAKNPGARKRELGEPCGEWHCNLIGIISELENEGIIYQHKHRIWRCKQDDGFCR